MSFLAKDGSKHTNIDTMKRANASQMAKMPSKGAPSEPAQDESSPDEQGALEPHQEQIHDHLRSMHEQTGEAHSHVEHHGDGTHTSHHVDSAGEVTGPAKHASAEELVEHLKSHLPEEEAEIAKGGDEEGY